jgi:hypothetical protein
MGKNALKASVQRHGFNAGNTAMAIARIRRLVDEDDQGQLRLLQPGLLAAEGLIASARVDRG